MPPTGAALSQAAKARMSAQETVCGHLDSISAFALSITLKPRRLGLFAGLPFSRCYQVWSLVALMHHNPAVHVIN